MGITGSWNGFVADTYNPYNYGNFGGGYGTGNFWASYYSKYGHPYNCGATAEASSMKIWATHNMNKVTDEGLFSGWFGSINLAPYNTLNVVLNSTYNMVVYAKDSSNSVVAYVRGALGNDTMSINVSNIYITVNIEITYDASFGWSSYETRDFHIYKIWFT